MDKEGARRIIREKVQQFLKNAEYYYKISQKETTDAKRIREDTDNLQNKLNDIVYELYEINNQEREQIRNFLKQNQV